MICSLQAREPGKTVVKFPWSLKAWALGLGAEGGSLGLSPKALELESWCPKAGKNEGLGSSRRSEFVIVPPFWSIQARNRLDGAHSHWWEWPSLFSLLIQIVINSRDTLTNTSRNVLPAIWASLSPAKSTYKINHDRVLLAVCSICSPCKVTMRY